MTIPKHKNPGQERIASAPYNFVPLPEVVVPAEDRPERDRYYHLDRYTGTIHCKLITKTPLYTRAALESGEAGSVQSKDKPQFFYVDPATREPVIPGSGLRGAIRTLVEIATYSKIQPVTDRQLFFRSLDNSTAGRAYGGRMTGGDRNKQGAHPNVSAGYMERHGHDFYIRPAQTLQGTQYYRIEEDLAKSVIRDWRSRKWLRKQIWFKPVPPTSHKPQSAQFYADVTDISTAPRPASQGWHEGVFVATGWIPKKHLQWIIGPPVENDNELVKIDQIDVDAYQEDGAGISGTIKTEGWSVLPKPDGKPIACFYIHWQDSDDRERIAFGHTAMFRLPYEKSPRDLLPAYLKDPNVTDMAEAIFGWVDDKKGRQIAGRVYFSDAHVESAENGLWVLEENEAPVRTLLSGPKPTTFQHYLTQPTDVKDHLLTYDDQGKTTLRGHKLYWHKDEGLSRSDYESHGTSDTQVTFLRPVKEGVTFAFDIHFENLTEIELGSILWVLEQCKLDNQHLKIGMGKPLGLGTVQLKPTLLLSQRLTRYRNLMSEWVADETEIALSTETRSFTKAFEDYIFNSLPSEARGDAGSYRWLHRIKALQTMLRWRGPEGTEYMQLEGFKQRNVLPDPLAVWEDNEPTAPPVSPPVTPLETGMTRKGTRDELLKRLGLA